MKTIIRLLALLALTLSPCAAQPLDFAWFGRVGGGIGAHDNGPFSRRLQSYIPSGSNEQRLLYRTEPFSNVGYTLNAGAAVLFGGDYVIGASGERLMFPTIEAVTAPGNPRDEYTLSGSGGGLDFGYVLVNEDATLLYPYLHAGYYGYSLEYRNNQTQAIPFFEGEPVPAGSTATYTGSAPLLGVGLELVKFVGGSGSSFGGMLVGARLGYTRMLGHPEWEQDGEIVNNGGHTPCYNTVSLTISIGGGMGSR